MLTTISTVPFVSKVLKLLFHLFLYHSHSHPSGFYWSHQSCSSVVVVLILTLKQIGLAPEHPGPELWRQPPYQSRPRRNGGGMDKVRTRCKCYKTFCPPPNEGIAQHMVLMPSVEQKIENNDATFMQIDAVKLSIAFKIAYYCCSWFGGNLDFLHWYLSGLFLLIFHHFPIQYFTKIMSMSTILIVPILHTHLTVATGTVVTGLAAGLKPRIVSWPTNEPNRRYMIYSSPSTSRIHRDCVIDIDAEWPKYP